MNPNIIVTAFDASTSRVHLKIQGEERREEVSSYLSQIDKRVFQLGTKTDIIPVKAWPQLYDKFKENEIIVMFLDGVEDEIHTYLHRADYNVTLDTRRGRIVLTKRDDFVPSIYQAGISTWQLEYGKYSVSTSEGYKIPLILPKYNPNVTFDYSDEVKVILEGEATKRQELIKISSLEDAPEIPDDIALKLMPFQRVAKKFSSHVGNRCIISYDMGLGKTPIAISIVEGIHKKLDNIRTLIVCPSTLKTNWKREIKKCTGEEAVILSGASPSDLAMNSILDKSKRYHIINFDILGRGETDKEAKLYVSNWALVLNIAQFDFIIIDEAHYIRNVNSGRSKAARELKSNYIIHLTGTPVVNRPGELWPLLNLIDPKKFSSKESFEGQWLYNDGKTIRNEEQFREMLSAYMIRRRKEDVIKDLPMITRIDHFIELSDPAKVAYKTALAGVYQSLRNPDYQKEINSVLAQITRLKQIVADDSVVHSASLARDINEETDKKVLIFSQFVDSCKEITYQLGNEALCITGEDTNDSRYAKIDRFQNDPSIKYMVLSTKAGAEGITLTAAHYVIFNDLCWTPKDHRQAEARCYGRLNDMHGATAYYIQAEGTITEMIMDIIREKLAIIEQTVDGINQDNLANVSIITEFLSQLKGKIG